MELESSLVAAQNAIITPPNFREPNRSAAEQQQTQQQRANTQLPPAQVVVRQGSAEAYQQADQYRKQQTYYDQPEGKARAALAAYQSLQLDAKRDEIKQFLGVDTYV
ncbi:hypothetical protein [Bowmanella sp. JS7-9]|uniref:Uncharacterized protein n=1 Tax=Pseudobowmanella zhangzhouensis TaxID=1537679 RepID=A0ABW1XIY5_9ALTE|nr:hypothetical protein [Bowmanella sp. JS7-9]TBX25731.1 hypothetical protein TK45_03315 [Bowmanella sp. JS7-9]